MYVKIEFNAKITYSTTALMNAFKNGHHEIIRLIISNINILRWTTQSLYCNAIVHYAI